MRMNKRAVAVALLTAGALALTGCSSAASDSGSSSGAADCTPSKGKVNLTFTTWIPGIEDVVAMWNEKNPDIQVKVQTGPNGNSGTYQNFFNQLKAGNAPDLGHIEYDALPSFPWMSWARWRCAWTFGIAFWMSAFSSAFCACVWKRCRLSSVCWCDWTCRLM